jgi:glycosyltransferase involved in cell wall biosynthesis
MKVSIAMCTFNGSKFIEEQLKSILTQSRLPDELVICDDKSNDFTAEIIKSFALNSPFSVRFYENKQNLGSTKNFEKAISLCTGDIIFLSDQDDIWEPQKIERILKVFVDNNKIGYVFTDAELVNEKLNSLGLTLWNSLNFNGKTYQKYILGQQIEVLMCRNYITGATTAFRAELKDKIIPISDYWIHDGWIAIIASSLDMYGFPLPECLIKYRQHAQQQLGVEISFLAQLKHKQALGAREYSKELASLYDLKERLLLIKAKNKFENDIILCLIDDKIKYLEDRIKIHSSRGIKKMSMIFKQIKLGNYQRFSSSWQSIGKDLLFRR